MWGTTTPATLTKTPLWDFNFMPWEKGNRGFRVHVRKAWEYFLAEDSQCNNDARRMNATLIFDLFFPPILNLYQSPVEHLTQTFIFSLHVSAFKKTTQIFHLFDLFIYFYSQTEHMTPAPLSPNPCHPKHNAIFQGKLGQSAVQRRRANNAPQLIVSHILSQRFWIQKNKK